MENNPSSLPALGDVMRISARITMDNAGFLMGVWACCHLPTQVLGFIVAMTSSLGSREDVRAAIEAGDFRSLAPLLALGILGFALGTLSYAATIIFAARALRSEPIDLQDVIIAGAKRVIPVGIASMIVGAACGFGIVLLILPGVYLLVRLCAAISAACIEPLGPAASVRRSWELTRGRFWEVSAFLSVLFCAGMVLAVVLMIAGGVLSGIGSLVGTPGRALAELAANAAQFLASSWGVVCMTKFYLELAERG